MDNRIAIFSGLFLIAATPGITALYQMDGYGDSEKLITTPQTDEVVHTAIPD